MKMLLAHSKFVPRNSFTSASRNGVLGKQLARSYGSTKLCKEISDRCDVRILSSPYAPIAKGPYPPLAEFVTAQWEGAASSSSGGGSGGGSGSGSGNSSIPKDKVAIIDYSTGLSRTYDDYYNTMGGLAGTFKYDMDIQEDSCVALYCPNHVDYLPICLAVSLCGAKVTPINPLYTNTELTTVLSRSRSSILLTHHTKLEVALQSAKHSKYIKHVIVINDNAEPIPEGTISLDSLRCHDKQFHQTIESIHTRTSLHPYLLPYSSGTTGLPKGVCLSHENIVANLLQMDQVESLSCNADTKLVTPLPFFHIYAFTVSMLYSAWKGMQVITNSGRFDLEEFCKVIQDYKPQRSHLVPPIILGLGKHPIIDNYNLSSMQTIISAAAPLGIQSEQAAKIRLKCNVKQAWGMSELSPIGTLNSDYNIRSGSVGPLVSSTYGKIIDENGKSLGPNQSGELLIKGPQVMMGYLDEPEKTRQCLSASGWLRTGDVAHYDEDGFIFITDRYKELIKVRGYQVAPAELEALLLTNEHVNDAAVIQVPDEASGELPRAYIVKKNTSEASQNYSEADLYDWVKERVSPYKRLDGGIVFTDVIPKSASGKILRRLLRDQLASEKK